MKQIYHPYTVWEDYKAGMWARTSNADINDVVTFTGDHRLYGAAMLRVIKEWPKSCEHNLTNRSQNQRAWIGHAACCLEFGWPEWLVRQAWGVLTEQQRVLANKAADMAINKWHLDRTNKVQLCINL